MGRITVYVPPLKKTSESSIYYLVATSWWALPKENDTLWDVGATFSDHVQANHAPFSYLCSHRGVRLLQQVPQLLPFLGAASVIEFFPLSLSHGLRLSPQFFVHLLFLLMVPGLAARLQVDLIDPPVIKLLAKRERAHLFHHVELPCPVEI